MQHRRVLLAAPLIALSLLAACGDDNGSKSSPTTTTEGYEIVSDAAVRTGWAEMVAEMTSLSATATSVTEAQLDEVHEKWESFEGTVKQNEPDLYLAAEEALDSFLEAGKDKDTAGMAAAVTKMSQTMADYLLKHPA